MNRPRAFGRKASPASRSSLKKASRTSAPTSKCSGPMAGPNQASNLAGGTSMAVTAASSTPAANPRHPACAAATISPESLANTTGRQSARQDCAHLAGSAGNRGICGTRRGGRVQIRDPRSVHLSQPGRLARQPSCRPQPATILGNRVRIVADVIAQIEIPIRRPAGTTVGIAPLGREDAHTARRGPIRLKPGDCHRAPSSSAAGARILPHEPPADSGSPAGTGLWNPTRLPVRG